MPVLATRTTHVKLYRACPAAWWFTAIAQVPTKGSAAMSFGSLAHRQLELWWRHGTAPTYPLVQAALPVLEQLLRRLGVEPAFRAQGTAGRAEWNFKVMVLGLQYGGTSDLVLITPDGQVWILDYKTTANAHRFGLTSGQLANDLQLGVYGYHALRQFAPHEPGVHVAHMQLQRVDDAGRPHGHREYVPQVELVEAWMPADRASAIWQSVEATVAEMQRDAEKPVVSVRGEREYCGAYSGCSFKNRCPHYRGPAALETEMLPYTPSPVAQSLPPPPPQPAPVLWLMLDTAPQAGWQYMPQPIQHLDSLLAPHQQRVAQQEGVPHYGLIDFAKGRAAVVALLAAGPLPAGTVIVDTMTPCAEAAIEYLRPRAAVVLQRNR